MRVWLDLNRRSTWQRQIKPVTKAAQAGNQMRLMVRLQGGKKWHRKDPGRNNDLFPGNTVLPRGKSATGFRSRCQVTLSVKSRQTPFSRQQGAEPQREKPHHPAPWGHQPFCNPNTVLERSRNKEIWASLEDAHPFKRVHWIQKRLRIALFRG